MQKRSGKKDLNESVIETLLRLHVNSHALQLQCDLVYRPGLQ
jgi:hypothetical protein